MFGGIRPIMQKWVPGAPLGVDNHGDESLTIAAIMIGAFVGTVQASFFEWTFHRYWLHRPRRPREVFRAHTLVHHQLCKFEDTFHVVNEEQEEALTFDWWAGPVLIGLNALPWAVLSLGLSLAGVTWPYLIYVATVAVTITVYYLAYEGTHLLMHKPMIPLLENSPAFKFIKHHHLIHHIHMNRNFNVVLPLADLCLGTLLLKMPTDAPRVTSETAGNTAKRYSKRRPVETVR